MRSVLPSAAAAGTTPHNAVKQSEKTQNNRTMSSLTLLRTGIGQAVPPLMAGSARQAKGARQGFSSL
jgi:hypothetical protein